LIEDLSTMPHLLVSGTTGSGKSVFTNCLISSLLFNMSPRDLRFIMIDPKMIELTPYNGIPHLLKPVISDVEEAKEALVWAEQEMDRRYQMFLDVGARNIESYNQKIKDISAKTLAKKLGKNANYSLDHMPYIVVVIDELADLMITQGKEVERPITRIAQKARACGIHLVLATQRPSAEIVTGLIKTNFPSRISFKVSSSIDSRTILDASGGEKLLGQGDMLYLPNGRNIIRVQGSYLSEDEVARLVKYIKED
jgi:DNA segregation ATPase FtsK/SpoIIIE, S-DNA-T family